MPLVGPHRALLRRRVLPALAGAVAAASPVSAARAQPLRAPAGVHTVRVAPDSLDAFRSFRGATGTAPADPKRVPLWAPLASAVVPGAGQALLRKPHGIVYGAIEAYMWLSARDARRFSNEQRDEYRNIARTIARRDAPGTKPDGTWEYYEELEKLCTRRFPFGTRCLSSGVFDKVPGGELDPETDMATFNGQLWALAQETYGTKSSSGAVVPPPVGSAQYARALSYYRGLAQTPEFYWSWVGQQQQQDVYRQAIAKSNQKWNEYRHDMHVIIANHVLSMVDAAVTVRIRRYGTPGVSRDRRTGVEATIPWAPFGRPGRTP